jgi:hypothetical protein
LKDKWWKKDAESAVEATLSQVEATLRGAAEVEVDVESARC